MARAAIMESRSELQVREDNEKLTAVLHLRLRDGPAPLNRSVTDGRERELGS